MAKFHKINKGGERGGKRLQGRQSGGDRVERRGGSDKSRGNNNGDRNSGHR